MKKFPFILIIIACGYLVAFYPRQSMPCGIEITVVTPEWYNNDCLHPCVREYDGMNFLSQSPDYSWNFKYENPLFYQSNYETNWQNGVELYKKLIKCEMKYHHHKLQQLQSSERLIIDDFSHGSQGCGPQSCEPCDYIFRSWFLRNYMQ